MAINIGYRKQTGVVLVSSSKGKQKKLTIKTEKPVSAAAMATVVSKIVWRYVNRGATDINVVDLSATKASRD